MARSLLRRRSTTAWRPDLLGGVVSSQAAFTDGSPMLAIPNYARYNRNPPPAPRPPTPADPGAARPAPPPATSIVWIRER